MNAAVLFISAWLANSPDFPATETSRQDAHRGVLDVVVFYAGTPRDVERYPLQVRQELQRFLERARTYRPRPRPARLGSEMQMVSAEPTEALRARRAYEESLKTATSDSRSALMTTAASELKASGRCYATNPFTKRRE